MSRATWRRWRAMRASWSMRATGCGRCGRSISFRTPRTSKRLSRFLVSGLDQAFEELAELAGAPEILRVPLHGDAILRIGFFHRLDHAVGRGRGDLESLRDLFHRLVMAAVHMAGLIVLHVFLEQFLQL